MQRRMGSRFCSHQGTGVFIITPVTEEDTLTERICHALREVKMMEDGILPKKSEEAFLDELRAGISVNKIWQNGKFCLALQNTKHQA